MLSLRLGLRSFRLRIFLLTALIVVTVLAAVVVLGWSRVLAYELQRLDERLCGEVRRLPNMPPPVPSVPGRADDQRRLEDDIGAKLRLRSPQQLLLELTVRGEPPLRSANWPSAIDLQTLPWVAGAAPGAGLPLPGRMGMGRGPGPGPGLGPPRPGRPPPAICELASFALEGRDWHAARVQPPWATAVLAADTAALRSDMREALQRALVVVLPLALLLTAGGAWGLAHLALRPVARLRQAMQAVDGTALDQRLPSTHEDREFRPLIGAYNTMLERLQASFQQATRFSADAAHELRTPLTILQGQIEQAIRQAEHRDIQVPLSQMQDELSRLAAITRKLLLLSQADAGRLALLRSPVDLSALLADTVADLRMSGPELQLSADVAPGLVVHADRQLLEQLLNNLGSNALKYAPPAGRLHLCVKAVAGGVELDLENSCAPLSPAARARFFERFYRGDAAHNRRVDGHGLGLSLAREIARAHGGELSLMPSTPDTVHLRLFLPTGAPAASR
jgi:signal transduction histidine kinase